jgi:hypothetical protein
LKAAMMEIKKDGLMVGRMAEKMEYLLVDLMANK